MNLQFITLLIFVYLVLSLSREITFYFKLNDMETWGSINPAIFIVVLLFCAYAFHAAGLLILIF